MPYHNEAISSIRRRIIWLYVAYWLPVVVVWSGAIFTRAQLADSFLGVVTLVAVGVAVALAIAAYRYAEASGRNGTWWALGSLILPYITPIILLMRESRPTTLSPSGSFMSASPTQQRSVPPETAPVAGERSMADAGICHRSGVKTYFSNDWNFSIDYPADWEVLWENESAGSWTIPIGVAGKQGDGGRPCFSVNVRRREILEGSATFKVTRVGPNGHVIEAPSTPQEYIEMRRLQLPGQFERVEFISAEECRVEQKPAARLVYSYAGQRGRIQEECLTLFGVGVTFQFICEVPVAEAAAFAPVFASILGSFCTGRKRADNAALPQGAAPPTAPQAPLSAEEMYDRGVASYTNGQFHSAMDSFHQCYQSGQYRMQTAYLRGLCRRQLGLEVEIPADLGEEPEDAGAVYVASNLACYLASKGHLVSLSKKGRSSVVSAVIDGSSYHIYVTSLLGTFLNKAWRQEGRESVALSDASVNPTDKFVMSLLGKASSLPVSPLPAGGLRMTEQPE